MPVVSSVWNQALDMPQWKERRARYLAQFPVCFECGTATNLTVHHVIYFKDRLPWEYQDSQLLTLCWPHHVQREREEDWIIESVLMKLKAYKQRDLERYRVAL